VTYKVEATRVEQRTDFDRLIIDVETKPSMLPRDALGWSLFGFNSGVEIGQGFIVLTVAPLLALLHERSALVWERVVAKGALCVTSAGAFWFFQRIVG
jgi:hypothetical protein